MGACVKTKCLVLGTFFPKVLWPWEPTRENVGCSARKVKNSLNAPRPKTLVLLLAPPKPKLCFVLLLPFFFGEGNCENPNFGGNFWGGKFCPGKPAPVENCPKGWKPQGKVLKPFLVPKCPKVLEKLPKCCPKPWPFGEKTPVVFCNPERNSVPCSLGSPKVKGIGKAGFPNFGGF